MRVLVFFNSKMLSETYQNLFGNQTLTEFTSSFRRYTVNVILPLQSVKLIYVFKEDVGITISYQLTRLYKLCSCMSKAHLMGNLAKIRVCLRGLQFVSKH